MMNRTFWQLFFNSLHELKIYAELLEITEGEEKAFIEGVLCKSRKIVLELHNSFLLSGYDVNFLGVFLKRIKHLLLFNKNVHIREHTSIFYCKKEYLIGKNYIHYIDDKFNEFITLVYTESLNNGYLDFITFNISENIISNHSVLNLKLIHNQFTEGLEVFKTQNPYQKAILYEETIKILKKHI